MSTVKISDLAALTTINANTANTLFVGVDIPTNVTGKLTAHTLARGLYSNEILNVGARIVDLPNTIGQFSLNSASYIQTNLVNLDEAGTADYVVTANTGTDTSYFIDVGYANKDFSPGATFNSLGTAANRLDGYLYVQGSTSNTWGGNLVVGAVSTGKEIRFIAGGGAANAVVAKMSSSALTLNRNVVFADGTSQNTSSGSAGTYANGAFGLANSAFGKANSAFGAANSAGVFANSAADSAATALINAGVADAKAVTSGRYANSAFSTANSAGSYANSAFLQANTPSYTANSAASYANAAFLQANGAYNSVNTALQNTSTITVDTNLTVPGTLVAGSTTINNGISIADGGLYQYTTANNATVTQLTSKSTSVIANGRTGQITTHNASLAKGAAVQFTVNNNQIVSNKDVVIVNIASGATAASYMICVDSVSVGSFGIIIENVGAGPLAEALVINFAILRVN